jgi:Bacterial Ig-like domain (group 2)
MLVAVGGSAQLQARILDASSNPVSGATPTFQSSDQSIATVDANGLVTGLRAGVSTIGASYGGVTGTTKATVVTPTSISGRVAAIDGGSVAGLEAGLESGTGANAQDFTASLDATGSFQIAAPLTFGATDSMSVLVDVASGARRYHPTFALVSTSRASSAALRPMLVPRTSVFSTPAYPSSSVDVSLTQAFQRVCVDDTNANCNSFFPQLWKSAVVLWSDADFPIPLAFNTQLTTSPITATDSVNLWNIIGEMQNELGRQLFVPATLSSLPAQDANGYSRKAVLVWVDNGLTGFAGYTNWIWDGGLNMLSAKTRVTTNAALASRSLMKHELLHALGFHHTCAWTTVMGGYGCGSAQSVTKSDAAAFALGYQTRRTILSAGPTTTLGDALRGEQLREASVVAARTGIGGVIPFAPLAAKQVFFGGRLVSADGAP